MSGFKNYFKRVFGNFVKGSSLYPDTIFGELTGNNIVPGLAITVIRKGETLLQKGYGYADVEKGEKADPSKTLFRIASASKPIAAMALAKMVSQGEIDLDRSFRDYVPYFPKKKFDFTIRQLASHTAGIRAYRGKEYALDKPYSIRESLVLFQDDPLQFEPGTDFLYNSFDWVLVSLAMEEISGISFSDYVAQNVLNPLGMLHTVEEDPSLSLRNKAQCYTRTKSGFRKAIRVDNRYKLAGGGFLSTSEDLAKFGLSCLQNTLVPQEIFNEFIAPVEINNISAYYGLGWQVSQDASGRPYFGHVGNGVGGYSNLYIYPEDEVVIAILLNCTDPKVQSTLDEVIDYMLTKYPVV
jgi:CubicO group peptidase (beta-lactamase class C family)